MTQVKTSYVITIPSHNIELYFNSISIEEGKKTTVFTTLDKHKARTFNRIYPAQTMCDMLKEWMKRDDLYVAEACPR